MLDDIWTSTHCVDPDFDEPEPDDYATDYCPFCDTENAPMGQLGNRLHFTCRQCGMWWSQEKNDDNLDKYDPMMPKFATIE